MKTLTGVAGPTRLSMEVSFGGVAARRASTLWDAKFRVINLKLKKRMKKGRGKKDLFPSVSAAKARVI